MKHGLRAGSHLLPGDDVAAFRKLRRDYFHFYKPGTVAEARCVERIVSCEWRMLRCESWQGVFDGPVEDCFPGGAKAAGAFSQPDPHRLEHRGADCTVQERRLQVVLTRAEARLDALQWRRAHNLAADNEAVQDFRIFLAEGEPVEPTDRQDATPAGGNAAEPTPSADMRNAKRSERNPASPPRPHPKHWSRRQRETAARRTKENEAPQPA